MRIRLLKKLAEVIDGVNLKGYSEGDLLDVDPFGARLLIAEGWAIPEPLATGEGENGSSDSHVDARRWSPMTPRFGRPSHGRAPGCESD